MNKVHIQLYSGMHNLSNSILLMDHIGNRLVTKSKLFTYESTEYWDKMMVGREGIHIRFKFENMLRIYTELYKRLKLYKLKYLGLLNYYSSFVLRYLSVARAFSCLQWASGTEASVNLRITLRWSSVTSSSPNCSGREDQGHPLSCLQVWLPLWMVPVLTEQNPTPEPTWFTYKVLPSPD